MNKKKSIILLIIILLIIILLGAKIISNNNKNKTSVDDFASIRELIEYDGHKYIDMKKSSEESFEKDIFIEFNAPPIDSTGNTNKNLYEILIKHISAKMIGQNFRIIDEQKDITVRIKFENNEIKNYTINNDNKYWSKLEKSYQINTYSEERKTNFNINSEIITKAINSNWTYNSQTFGTKDSTFSNYDIFFEEGYKIRSINSQIYNIVFTKNYKDSIINQITTGTDLKHIEQILGEATFRSDINDIIGYKGEELYVFFKNDEISIYPVEKYDQNRSKRFGKIVSELNTSGDINTFLNRLTDLYPDYETYYKTENYVNLIYPLKGFEVIIGSTQNNGLTLYSNFIGQVTEDVSMEDIIKNKEMPVNVHGKLEKNLVLQAEEERVSRDETSRSPYINVAKAETDEYVVLEENNIYQFLSTNKDKIDSELAVLNLTNIISHGQNIFIYGVKDDGIYAYNAETMQLIKLLQGKGEFNIINIEDNRIYYDNSFIQL